MTRWELFKGHWKQIREDGKKCSEPWWVGGSYNRWNCFWWALHNSRTHDLNGEYLIPVGNKLEEVLEKPAEEAEALKKMGVIRKG